MGAQSLAKLLRGSDILGDSRMSWDLRASEAVRCPMAIGEDGSPVSCCCLQSVHADSSRVVVTQQLLLSSAKSTTFHVIEARQDANFGSWDVDLKGVGTWTKPNC
jgi:hypothetical protein